jgi:hypothetical protein
LDLLFIRRAARRRSNCLQPVEAAISADYDHNVGANHWKAEATCQALPRLLRLTVHPETIQKRGSVKLRIGLRFTRLCGGLPYIGISLPIGNNNSI